MRIENRPVRIYEEGDYVRTCCGVGVIAKVEEIPLDWTSGPSQEFQRVWVQHKFSSSDNTSNRPQEIESSLHIIDKSEYDKETF